MVNPRDKGANGEREIVDILNFEIYSALKELEFPEYECLKGMRTVQRNQNQSAVGGNDLSNCLGLSIEIKRQEDLSVGSWWAQCLAAAQRNNEMPVLMYKQNRKPWRIRTFGWVNLPDSTHLQAIVEFDIDTFKSWFRKWAKAKILSGELVRI